MCQQRLRFVADYFEERVPFAPFHQMAEQRRTRYIEYPFAGIAGPLEVLRLARNDRIVTTSEAQDLPYQRIGVVVRPRTDPKNVGASAGSSERINASNSSASFAIGLLTVRM